MSDDKFRGLTRWACFYAFVQTITYFLMSGRDLCRALVYKGQCNLERSTGLLQTVQIQPLYILLFLRRHYILFTFSKVKPNAATNLRGVNILLQRMELLVTESTGSCRQTQVDITTRAPTNERIMNAFKIHEVLRCYSSKCLRLHPPVFLHIHCEER